MQNRRKSSKGNMLSAFEKDKERVRKRRKKRNLTPEEVRASKAVLVLWLLHTELACLSARSKAEAQRRACKGAGCCG